MDDTGPGIKWRICRFLEKLLLRCFQQGQVEQRPRARALRCLLLAEKDLELKQSRLASENVLQVIFQSYCPCCVHCSPQQEIALVALIVLLSTKRSCLAGFGRGKPDSIDKLVACLLIQCAVKSKSDTKVCSVQVESCPLTGMVVRFELRSLRSFPLAGASWTATTSWWSGPRSWRRLVLARSRRGR